jgi:hypothetical protein
MVLATRQVMMNAALAGILLLAAGCSSSPPGTATRAGPGPGAGGTSVGASAAPSLGETSNSLVLPLTPYYPSPQQVADVDNMQSALISLCLQQAGFNRPALVYGPMEWGGDPGRGQFYDFGVTSMAFAERYGYQDTDNTSSVRTTAGSVDLAALKNISAAERTAVQACDNKIGAEDGSADSGWGSLVQELAIQAYEEAKADPRVLAAFKEWSSCMAAKGFDYANPLDADIAQQQGGDTGPPTELEIQTATTDVACKEKTGLLKTWISVLAADQNALLPANLPQLRASMAQFESIYGKDQRLLAKGQ